MSDVLREALAEYREDEYFPDCPRRPHNPLDCPGDGPEDHRPAPPSQEDVARAIDPEAFADWSGAHDPRAAGEQVQRVLTAHAAAVRVLTALPAPPDAARLIEIVLEHEPYLDQTACYDGGCDCGWKGTEIEHEAHRLAAVAEALMLPAPPVVDVHEVWEQGYDRAETDRDGTGFWARGKRANPYPAVMDDHD